MSVRKQHAYEVALRMARVKELRAQMALAESVDKEEAARKQVETVESARAKVSRAAQACVDDNRPIDLARYELLTQLSSALTDNLQVASHKLEQASLERSEKASDNVLAKRHREHVHEHLDDVRVALAHTRAAKALEEGIELWLESRAEEP
jgi:predicted RNase H-like HicB family nuclease